MKWHIEKQVCDSTNSNVYLSDCGRFRVYKAFSQSAGKWQWNIVNSIDGWLSQGYSTAKSAKHSVEIFILNS
jgi:hypothetical protein